MIRFCVYRDNINQEKNERTRVLFALKKSEHLTIILIDFKGSKDPKLVQSL